MRDTKARSSSVRETRALWTMVFGLAAVILVLIGIVVFVWVKLSHDEHVACVIQRNGLPVGHDAAAVNKDFYLLLTLPRTAAQKRAQPRETPHQLHVVTKTTDDLHQLQVDEAKQPNTRFC